MPSYNTDRFIAESIQSVLMQTYPNWELLIVDDCSSDHTVEIIQSFADPRIKFFENSTNLGAASCRNTALRNAKGRWIAFLDSDDIWMPEKLEKQIRFMETNGYGFSCTARESMDENSIPTGEITKSPRRVGKIGMYLYCWPGCLGTMYDASKVGLIQVADLKKNNDYAMWLRVIHKTDFYFLDEVLARYRIRKKSISHDSLSRLIKSHYELFRYGEHFGRFKSAFMTLANLVFGLYKKLFYVKRKATKRETT